MTFRFLPCQHIRRGEDFKKAYNLRCSVRDALLLVYCGPNGLEYARLGLSVSKKVGKAVARNRWKRRIREAFRLNQQKLPAGLDVVVIPLAREEPDFPALCASLVSLAQRGERRLAKMQRAPVQGRPT